MKKSRQLAVAIPLTAQIIALTLPASALSEAGEPVNAAPSNGASQPNQPKSDNDPKQGTSNADQFLHMILTPDGQIRLIEAPEAGAATAALANGGTQPNKPTLHYVLCPRYSKPCQIGPGLCMLPLDGQIRSTGAPAIAFGTLESNVAQNSDSEIASQSLGNTPNTFSSTGWPAIKYSLDNAVYADAEQSFTATCTLTPDTCFGGSKSAANLDSYLQFPECGTVGNMFTGGKSGAFLLDGHTRLTGESMGKVLQKFISERTGAFSR